MESKSKLAIAITMAVAAGMATQSVIDSLRALYLRKKLNSLVGDDLRGFEKYLKGRVIILSPLGKTLVRVELEGGILPQATVENINILKNLIRSAKDYQDYKKEEV